MKKTAEVEVPASIMTYRCTAPRHYRSSEIPELMPLPPSVSLLSLRSAFRCYSLNPSTLDENPLVPVSTQKDVDRAVQGAKIAAESWAAVPYKGRQKAVARFADGLETLKSSFAVLLTSEQGKPVSVPRFLFSSLRSLTGNSCKCHIRNWMCPSSSSEGIPSYLSLMRSSRISLVAASLLDMSLLVSYLIAIFSSYVQG